MLSGVVAILEGTNWMKTQLQNLFRIRTLLLCSVLVAMLCGEASATYRVRVSATDLYARCRAGSYLFGRLYNGNAFDVQYVDSNNWCYGYAYGYVNRCGWTQRGYTYMVNEGANTYCRSSPMNIADSEFMGAGPYGGCCDGELINIGCGAYVWDNWIESSHWGNNNYRGYWGAGTPFYRRWVTKDMRATWGRIYNVSDWVVIAGCF